MRKTAFQLKMFQHVFLLLLLHSDWWFVDPLLTTPQYTHQHNEIHKTDIGANMGVLDRGEEWRKRAQVGVCMMMTELKKYFAQMQTAETDYFLIRH
jgi:hypothetical protein